MSNSNFQHQLLNDESTSSQEQLLLTELFAEVYVRRLHNAGRSATLDKSLTHKQSLKPESSAGY